MTEEETPERDSTMRGREEESTVAGHELVIVIEVPAGQSRESLVEKAKKIARAADTVYRAHGGSGLKVDTAETWT